MSDGSKTPNAPLDGSEFGRARTIGELRVLLDNFTWNTRIVGSGLKALLEHPVSVWIVLDANKRETLVIG